MLKTFLLCDDFKATKLNKNFVMFLIFSRIFGYYTEPFPKINCYYYYYINEIKLTFNLNICLEPYKCECVWCLMIHC